MMHPSVDGCIVSGTLSFVLRLSRVYGVAPVRLVKVHDGWRMHSSLGAYIYQIGTVLIMCAYIVGLLLSNFYLDGRWSYFDRINTLFVSRFTSAITAFLVLAANTYSGVPRIKTVICCLQQLQKINTELNKYGPRTSYEKTQRRLTIYVLVSVHIATALDTSIFMRSILKHNHTFEDILAHTLLLFVHNYKTLMAKVLILQICFLMAKVLSSFNHLNTCFNVLLEQVYNEYRIKTSSKEINETLSKIGYLYCSLHRVAQVLGQCYEIVFIPLLLFFTVHLIRALFILINKLIAGSVVVSLGMMQLVWASQYFGDMLMIVEPCHRSCQQIKRTKILLSQLMYYTDRKDDKLVSELHLFYKHLMTNDVLFDPMDICELNRAVILSVFGTMVTYLVIALQVNNTP